ncbi:MAG: PqqD family protein [Acidimicrobiales bacterium]
MELPGGMPSTVRRRPDALWREVDGQVVGLDLGSSRYFSLNDTGRVLWCLLEEPVDVAVLVAELVRRFGVDEERAHEDVEAFLEALGDYGLLVT